MVMSLMAICDTLRDLVPFDQFKKREKYSWRSITFSKKVTLLHGAFFTCSKLYKWYQIAQKCFIWLLYTTTQIKTIGSLNSALP